MAADPQVAAIDKQIADLQARITTLDAQKNELLRSSAVLDTMRPAGVLPTWLPIYEQIGGNPSNYRVTAWYDPQKWGTGCNVVGKQT
jgi:hypothetical protein